MSGGEVCTQTFNLISSAPVGADDALNLPETTVLDCCFSLSVLAQLSGTVDTENDKVRVLFAREENITDILLKLDKFVAGSFSEVANLTDDTYGTNFPFAFFQTLNADGSVLKNYRGYEIEWQKVLIAFGEGTYRIRTEETTIFATTVNNFSLEWCLKIYTPERADGTVRISYIQDGIIADINNYKLTKDYFGLNWFNQIRIPAFFGNETSTYEREYVEFTNRQRKSIADTQEPEFSLNTRRLPSFVHDILKTDVLQANQILITDYNKNNVKNANGSTKYVDFCVQGNSDYDPQWNESRSVLASVEIKFRLEFNTFRKKNC